MKIKLNVKYIQILTAPTKGATEKTEERLHLQVFIT